MWLAGCSLAPPSDTQEKAPDTVTRVESLERHAKRITLRVRNQQCLSVGSGSGFAIDQNYLVTNRHVVEGADSLEVNTWDGQTIVLDVHNGQVAIASDVAILRVPEPLPETSDAADEDPPPGANVTAVGHPLGKEVTLTHGKVIDYISHPEFGEGQVMRMTAEIHPGSSGSALLNDAGQVVGVVFAMEIATGYGLAIPLSSLRETFEGLFTSISGGCR